MTHSWLYSFFFWNFIKKICLLSVGTDSLASDLVIQRVDAEEEICTETCHEDGTEESCPSRCEDLKELKNDSDGHNDHEKNHPGVIALWSEFKISKRLRC